MSRKRRYMQEFTKFSAKKKRRHMTSVLHWLLNLIRQEDNSGLDRRRHRRHPDQEDR